MALQILDTVGNRVYIGGYVDLEEINDNGIDVIQVTGLDVEQGDTWNTHEIDQAALAGAPGFGAGKLLRYICNKIKEALCSNCA
jgi:hypothetical protein